MADTDTTPKATAKPAAKPATKAPAKRATPKADTTPKVTTPAKPKAATSSSVIDKARDATSKLAGEAVTAARHAANEGKDRASDALTSVSKAVEGAASLVEEKVGAQYGGYARKAADQVSGFADTLKSKDIDDIVADTRDFVRKQPMIAIGAAAAIGFVLTRLVKIGGSGRNDA